MANRLVKLGWEAKYRARLLRRHWQVDRGMKRALTVPLPSQFAAFGDGSVIVPPGRVNNPQCISIGRDVQILEQGWLAVYPQQGLPTPRLEIGDGTHIGRACHIACIGEVVIGPEVLTADHIYIADTYHGFEDDELPIRRQPMAPPKPVRIERGAFLGIRSVILQGVTVGENAYVGAGAVVTEDVAPRTLVVGNPARPIRAYDPDSGEWRSV